MILMRVILIDRDGKQFCILFNARSLCKHFRQNPPAPSEDQQTVKAHLGRGEKAAVL